MTGAGLAEAVAGSRHELTVEAVTTQQLVRYAGASGDYNRIHYDQAHAIESGLGGVIAHGMLTMAFMGRAASELAGPRGFVKRLSARFTAPVRPGDAVHVVAVVQSRERRGEHIELQCELKADVREKTVAVGAATVLLPASA